jgi:hypothetical protein
MARKPIERTTSGRREFIEDTEDDNVINMEIARKALAESEPPDGDTWIDRLEEGTVFLAEEKNSFNFICPQFLLLEKWDRAVRLYSYTKGDTQTFFVSKNKFCNRFALTETISIIPNVDAMLKILTKDEL